MNYFRENNDIQDKSCHLALKQALPDEQIILMTDASFHKAVYAIVNKNQPNQKKTQKPCPNSI